MEILVAMSSFVMDGWMDVFWLVFFFPILGGDWLMWCLLNCGYN